MPDKVINIDFWDSLHVIEGAEFNLKVEEKVQADHKLGFSPVYRFVMLNRQNDCVMGQLSLRIGYTHNDVNYRGNIGFTVHDEYRGAHLAEKSCRLVFPVAKHHSMNVLWFTCNTNNIASAKTIEKLGAEFMGVVEIPDSYEYSWYYPQDSRLKRRYKLDI